MRYLLFSVIAIVGAQRPFVHVGDGDKDKIKLNGEPADFLFPDDAKFWDRILSEEMSTSTSMSMHKPTATPPEPTPSGPTHSPAHSKSPVSEPRPSRSPVSRPSGPDTTSETAMPSDSKPTVVEGETSEPSS